MMGRLHQEPPSFPKPLYSASSIKPLAPHRIQTPRPLHPSLPYQMYVPPHASSNCQNQTETHSPNLRSRSVSQPKNGYTEQILKFTSKRDIIRKNVNLNYMTHPAHDTSPHPSHVSPSYAPPCQSLYPPPLSPLLTAEQMPNWMKKTGVGQRLLKQSQQFNDSSSASSYFYNPSHHVYHPCSPKRAVSYPSPEDYEEREFQDAEMYLEEADAPERALNESLAAPNSLPTPMPNKGFSAASETLLSSIEKEYPKKGSIHHKRLYSTPPQLSSSIPLSEIVLSQNDWIQGHIFSTAVNWKRTPNTEMYTYKGLTHDKILHTPSPSTSLTSSYSSSPELAPSVKTHFHSRLPSASARFLRSQTPTSTCTATPLNLEEKVARLQMARKNRILREMGYQAYRIKSHDPVNRGAYFRKIWNTPSKKNQVERFGPGGYEAWIGGQGHTQPSQLGAKDYSNPSRLLRRTLSCHPDSESDRNRSGYAKGNMEKRRS